MSDFKNSFYSVATKIAKKNPLSAQKQLTLIDNFTAESPILKELPFEQASHDCHHVYGRLLDATSMQVTDFDGVLPSMQTDSQLESIYLTPFGGKFEFGEDRMRLTHDTPESYLAAQIPPVLRKTGMALEHRMPFKTHYFVFSDIVLYGTTSSTKGVVYETPQDKTWEKSCLAP